METATPRVFKRQHITTEKKKQIIEASANKTLTEVSKQFQIPRSTCQSILRNKEAILEAIKNGIGLKRARLTKGRNTVFDSALLVWVRSIENLNVLLTPSILREKALELAAEMNVDGFQASNGWLDRFQGRNAISLHRAQSENNELSEETIKTWQQTVLQRALSKYHPDDVFSVDETEIYWQIQSNKTPKEDNSGGGGKRIKERITVLVGSNMSGSEKLPLFIVGNSKKLDHFEDVNIPITYIGNERAWMTSEIFVNWLNEWDAKLQEIDRKILLYVDRCQAHPKIQLQNIKLKYFLPKMCSAMQPMNQGVLQSFKLQYRRLLPQSDPILTMFDNPETINLSTALAFLYQAWEQVTPTTISNCFRKSEFVIQEGINSWADSDQNEESADEEEFLSELQTKIEDLPIETVENTVDNTVFSDDYGDSNEEFSTSNAFLLAEIAKVCAKSEQTPVEDEPLETKNEQEIKVPNRDARTAFSTVRRYIQQNSNDSNLLALCDIIEAFLEMDKS